MIEVKRMVEININFLLSHILLRNLIIKQGQYDNFIYLLFIYYVNMIRVFSECNVPLVRLSCLDLYTINLIIKKI